MSKPVQKLKFALVGCGRIAKKHIEAMRDLEQAELVAVSDIQAGRAQFWGEKLGIPYYDDYNKMLSMHNDIDVVNILTPSGLHAKHAIDIAKKYRKHIVCEKPAALRLNDADEIIKACKEAGVHFFVMMQNRYNLAVQKLKQALDEGRFGKIILGTVRVRWARSQEYYDADEWRGTWDMDGGCLTNQASHHIDLLTWLLGEPVEVTAKTATRLLDIEVEDTGAAIVKFANGALGIVEATTATRPKDLEGSVSILGEKGTVEIGGFAVNQIKTWLFEDQREEDKEVINLFNEAPPNVYGFGHQRYLAEVIDCILNGKKVPVDGIEGRKSLELIHAIYESAETGETVRIPFEPKKCRLGGIDHE
ncbi:Gfo/Idh/MocA family protein [Ammoniphilus sp. YIM 78166]|uniref:Gfo/Idh/MocA family protein n=1 Tax=Ammoniphilus sp. YIM 78166 TaxID=1644106 RepID=UPI00106F594E|nr:Gfo/Idh/MocA family oxidoreductase [Ammoniphilus sp. YIM 78166]